VTNDRSKKGKEAPMSIRRLRNTLRGAALILAIVLGLLAIETISIEASQVQTGQSSKEPSPNSSDNLSQKLNESKGVISPPTQVDPKMRVKPPSEEGSMRVVPPPGSPGGNPNVQPK